MDYHTLRDLFGVSVLLLLLTACAVQSDAASDGAATVTLQTFSGRSNPQWRLDLQQVTRLQGMIADLASAEQAPSDEGFPPYYGFLVSEMPEGSPFSELELYDGSIAVKESQGEVRWLSDPERTVERYLFESGKPYLDEQVYQMARDHFLQLGGQDSEQGGK